MSTCLLYGANGYTGRLLAHAALQHGIRPILAGRSQPKLEALANQLCFARARNRALRPLDFRTFDLQSPERIDTALAGVQVVLNAAGPFTTTSPPLIDACLRCGVHYLDISGEVSALDAVARRGAEALQKGVMLLPAVGFDVVPSDCLALFVARRVPNPVRLAIAVSNLTLVSRGSALTLVGTLPELIWVRRGGSLRGVPPGSLRRYFDFGAGPRLSQAVSWGDSVAAYHSTGIPDITTYFDSTAALRMHDAMLEAFGWALPRSAWQAWLRSLSQLLPEGPDEQQRAARRAVIVAEAENEQGQRAQARLITPEAYSLTSLTAIAILARVLAGDLEPGYQTPARLFGADYILGFPGVLRHAA
jgi:short subunit dehydrogenase-like uncharacterized protein